MSVSGGMDRNHNGNKNSTKRGGKKTRYDRKVKKLINVINNIKTNRRTVSGKLWSGDFIKIFISGYKKVLFLFTNQC